VFFSVRPNVIARVCFSVTCEAECYCVRVFVLQANRIKYNQQHYKGVFCDAASTTALDDSLNAPSLFTLVEVGTRTLSLLNCLIAVTTAQ